MGAQEFWDLSQLPMHSGTGCSEVSYMHSWGVLRLDVCHLNINYSLFPLGTPLMSDISGSGFILDTPVRLHCELSQISMSSL